MTLEPVYNAEQGVAFLMALTTQQRGIINQQAATIAGHSAAIPTKLPATVSAVNATRAMNTIWRVSATSPALVFYCVSLSVTAPLLSIQDCTVDLLSDASNPPSVSRGQAYLKSTQLAGLSLVSIQTDTRQQLVAFVPAGNYVTLSTSGAGTAALISSTELVFG